MTWDLLASHLYVMKNTLLFVLDAALAKVVASDE